MPTKFPQDEFESAVDYQRRLEVTKKVKCPVLPRASHESAEDFQLRMAEQGKAKQTIMPKVVEKKKKKNLEPPVDPVEDNVSPLAAFSSLSPEEKASFLEAAGGDVKVAVALFLDRPTGGASAATEASVCTRPPGCMYPTIASVSSHCAGRIEQGVVGGGP